MTTADAPNAAAFAADHGANYPIYARGGALFSAMGIRFVPKVYLVGPDGVVAADGLGAARERIEAGLDV